MAPRQPRRNNPVTQDDTLMTVFRINDDSLPAQEVPAQEAPGTRTSKSAVKRKPAAKSKKATRLTEIAEVSDSADMREPVNTGVPIQTQPSRLQTHSSTGGYHSRLEEPLNPSDDENYLFQDPGSHDIYEEPIRPLPGPPLSESPASTIDISVSPTTSDPDSPTERVLHGRRNQQTSPSHSQSRSPSTRTRSRNSPPRAGPHSIFKPTQPAVKGPAGNRKGHEAKDVWTFFQKEQEGSICTLCQKAKSIDPSIEIHTYGAKTSTSGLRKHLYDCHLEEWVDSCDALKIEIKAQEALKKADKHRVQRDGQDHTYRRSENPKKNPEFSNEAFVDAVTDFILADDQSINVVENEQLRKIFLMLRESLKDSDIPHRTTLCTRILERLDEYIEHVKKEMANSIGKISFTMDMWSDPNLTPFMGVTAHWIYASRMTRPDGIRYKLELRADLIGFHHVPGQHTGEHLAYAFIFITNRLDITQKIGWITLDNASNNDTFSATMERELEGKKIEFDQDARRIRCFPHIVNLACKAVLAAITQMKYAEKDSPDFEPPVDFHEPENFIEACDRDPVASVRSAVNGIRASSLRRQGFSDVLVELDYEDLQLIRDVDTRWSSTLLMISRALELQLPMDTFLGRPANNLKKYKLSTSEWDALRKFEEILSVPHAFQHLLSFEKTPTLAYTIPAFESMILQWKKLQDSMPEARDIIQRGIDKLEDYENKVDTVPAYALATLLNPRYKLRFFEKKLPGRVFEVKRMFLRELRPYFKTTAAPKSGPKEIKKDTSWASNLLGFDSPVKPSRGRTLDDEVTSYFLDTSESEDSISFWEMNQNRWPTIFALAMDILPIQGSAVPCERIFSSGKETTTARRNRISPSMMEALQILKFAIRNGRSLNFTEGTSREDELEELGAATADLLPSEVDIPEFTHSLRKLAAKKITT